MFSRENLKHLSSKFKQPKICLIAAAVTGLSYSLLALLDNINLITSNILPPDLSFLISIIPPLILEYPGSVTTTALTATVLTAILVGVNIGLLATSLTLEGFTAAPGAVLGLTVSGCAACTAGVVTIAGTSIGLGFLPLGGLEISITGISLLGLSALYISEKDRQKICEV